MLILKGIDCFAPDEAQNQSWVLSHLNTEDKYIDLELKKQLLGKLLDNCGPQLLLNLGQAFDQLPPTPLFYILLNSSSPEELLNKLEQYGHYFHSSNHLLVEERTVQQLVIKHISTINNITSAAEELFTCGIIKSLLKSIGCQNITCKWLQAGDPNLLKHLSDEDNRQVRLGNCTIWLFQWDKFIPVNKIPGLDNYLVSLVEPNCNYPQNSISLRIYNLLCNNIHNKHTLESVAMQLNISPRTLQRNLKKEGNNFARIMRDSRISVASSLLVKTKYSLSEIGLMTGFSDHAHFCREFKKVYNQTPSSFRRNPVLANNQTTG